MEKVKAAADEAFNSAVGQLALSWFSRHFPEYEEVITETVRGRALIFVERRTELIDRWVPGIRAGLDPFTGGHAAIKLLTDERGALSAAWRLRPRGLDEPPADPVNPAGGDARVRAQVQVLASGAGMRRPSAD